MAKEPPYPEAQRYNPSRPACWRWQRACHLVAAGQRLSRRRDEPLTCRAARYLRRLNGLCSERGMRNLTRQEPGLTLAVRLHQNGGLGRLELQCRLLARQSDRQIARTMGLTIGMVAVYEPLFFAVRDWLDAPGYILRVAGMPLEGPPSRETLMMLSAYHHGPHAVDAWLDYLGHAGEAHDLATAVGRRRESIELLIAVHSLPSDQACRRKLVKQIPFTFLDRQKLTKTSAVSDIVAESTRHILDGLPWRQPEQPVADAGGVPARRKTPRVALPGRQVA